MNDSMKTAQNASMAQLPQWVGHKNKIPKNPHTGNNAKSNDPATWADYDTAFNGIDKYKWDGIGFVFTRESNITGIDLDSCIDENGNLSDLAKEIVTLADSYTEISPSGRGLHIIVRGSIPTAIKLPEIEMYSEGRYFTYTGNRLPDTNPNICKRQSQIDELVKRFSKNGKKPSSPPPVQNQPNLSLSDSELLDKAQNATNGQAFFSLWRGDTTSYDSHSEAVMSLVNRLAFWTADDKARIDRLFRQSGLMCQKWDEVHYADGRTYGQGTIDKAVNSPHDVYTGQTPNSNQNGSTGGIFGNASPNGHSSATGQNNGQTTGQAPKYPPVSLNENLPILPYDVVKACYQDQEVGDGRMFSILYKDRIVFYHAQEKWYLWNGGYWKEDKTGFTHLLYCTHVTIQYLHYAGELGKWAAQARSNNEDEKAIALETLADGFKKRTSLLRQKSRSSNALHFARTQLAFDSEKNKWDDIPFKLPVANGLVDMKTGNLEPGKPSDFVRTIAPFDWNGIDESCPMFEDAINKIMGKDGEMASFIQRLFGASAGGRVEEHIFPIFWGENGRNGKDTIFETVGYVLGPLAEPISKDLLLDNGRRYSGQANPDMMELRGKRIVWASEPPEGSRLDSAQVKLITGGGQLKARQLYGEPELWEPTHHAFLLTNPRPHAPADDNALWARLLLIPFHQSFKENPDPNNPNEQLIDKQLKEKLKSEASGILAWLVNGFMEWQTQGLNVPKKILDAMDEYRNNEDTIGLFIQDKCITDPDDFKQPGDQEGKARAAPLYLTYQNWCNDMGLNPMSHIAFGRKFAKRYTKKRDNNGVYYENIEVM